MSPGFVAVLCTSIKCLHRAVRRKNFLLHITPRNFYIHAKDSKLSGESLSLCNAGLISAGCCWNIKY